MSSDTASTAASAPSNTESNVVNVAPAASTAASSSASAVASSEDAPGTIVVHHLQNSRSQRILWLLEELECPYRIVRYERLNGLAPPALLKVHPLGKSPVITDGPRTVAESGAIVEYLIRKHKSDAKLMVPTNEDEHLEYTYWMHASEGSVMPPLVMMLVFSGIRTKSPWIIRPIANAIADKVEGSFVRPTVEKMFQLIESQLVKQKAAGSEFFVGNTLTGADFMILFPLEAGASRAVEMMGPETKAYIARMQARPAYQKALAAGGEYAYGDSGAKAVAKDQEAKPSK